jgi:hypothetical protein
MILLGKIRNKKISLKGNYQEFGQELDAFLIQFS